MYLERSGYFAYILTYAKVVPLNLQKQASDQSLVKGQRSSTIPPSWAKIVSVPDLTDATEVKTKIKVTLSDDNIFEGGFFSK